MEKYEGMEPKDEFEDDEYASKPSLCIDGQGEYLLRLVSTPPEVKERFRDLIRLDKLQRGLRHAIKRENYEAAKILQGRIDNLLKKYEDENLDDLLD